MDEVARSDVREAVQQWWPDPASEIAENLAEHYKRPVCTEVEVLEEGCRWLARKHVLAFHELRTASDKAVGIRNRAQRYYPEPLQKSRRPDGTVVWVGTKGQVPEVRKKLERFREALTDTRRALSALIDDPIAADVLWDKGEAVGDLWEAAVEILDEFPEPKGDGTTRLRAWELDVGEVAALLWETSGKKVTRQRNRFWADEENRTAEKVYNSQSPFYQAFLPWLRLLGVEDPQAVLHEVHRCRVGKP